MAKKKIKNIFEDYEPLWKFVRGEAKWLYIKEPDDYDNWSLNLYGEEVEDLIPELVEYLAEAVVFAKEQGKEVKTVAEVYKTDQDGNKFIKPKKKKYDEDTYPPKIYNITGDEVTEEFNKKLGGGTKVRVKLMVKPYYMGTTKTVGLSTKLIAVQVIKPVEYAGGAGFDDESGGDTPPFDVENEDY